MNLRSAACYLIFAVVVAFLLRPDNPSLAGALHGMSGVWVLLVDAMAVAYILSPHPRMVPVFIGTAYVVALFNVALAVGDLWWKTVRGDLHGSSGVNVPPDFMDRLGPVVPWGLILFVAAPLIRMLVRRNRASSPPRL